MRKFDGAKSLCQEIQYEMNSWITERDPSVSQEVDSFV